MQEGASRAENAVENAGGALFEGVDWGGLAQITSDTQKLEKAAQDAIDEFSLGGLSPGQMGAALRNPALQNAMQGAQLDSIMKSFVSSDPGLSHIEITPLFQSGPDFVNRSLGVWWDLTTQA